MGLPIAVIAFGFLAAVTSLQKWVWQTLPGKLGWDQPTAWYAILVLGVAGVLVGLIVTRLPGRGGHVPAQGMGGGTTRPVDLTGVLLAAVLMLEVVGFAGRQVLLVLLPCLVSIGIGALIFTGMGSWTGLTVPSLKIPGLPAATIDSGDLLWVIPLAVLTAAGAQLCRRLGRRVATSAAAHTLAATTAAGLVVGAALGVLVGPLAGLGTTQLPVILLAAAVAMVTAVALDGRRKDTAASPGGSG